MTALRRIYIKLFRPNWWVFEWRTEFITRTIRNQSGSFAVSGGPYAWAIEEGLKQLEGMIVGEGYVIYDLRRPTFSERWSSL